jgi:hypothetical protein
MHHEVPTPLTELLTVFVDNLLPILLLAGVGSVLAWRVGLEARPLSQITFALLGPALVFDVILHSDVPPLDVARMAGFALVTMLLPAGLALVLGRLRRESRMDLSALVLVVLLSNAGNFGLSVVELSFGRAALAQAAVYFVVAVALTWTLGVMVASMGSRGPRSAALGVLRVPAVYAVLAALALRALGVGLPSPLARTVALLAGAAIPVMLLLLGVQLYHHRNVAAERPAWPALLLRLAVAPLLAALVAPLFGLHGPAFAAGLTQAAMPTAVVTTVLAEQYDLEVAYVTRVVVLSTLLAPLTLTPLLAWLH